ncbi:MAG: hypothetical protein ACM31O_17395 [Bacteroidota bacterium]
MTEPNDQARLDAAFVAMQQVLVDHGIAMDEAAAMVSALSAHIAVAAPEEVDLSQARMNTELALMEMIRRECSGSVSAAAAALRDLGFDMSTRMRRSADGPTISESQPKIALPQGVH